MKDLFREEVEITKLSFDLDNILEFQLSHSLEIIRGADYQYECKIDGAVYAVCLTPIMALWYGVSKYNSIN
jgi:hypothetical protein